MINVENIFFSSFVMKLFCDYGFLLRGITKRTHITLDLVCLSADKKRGKPSVIGRAEQQWVTGELISNLNSATFFHKLVEQETGN